MLTIEELRAKRENYANVVAEMNKFENIDIEVQKRFNEVKERIRTEVVNEINAKVITCQNYIDLLNELIAEAENSTDAPDNTTEQ